jgi:large subunit ribosomal protein LP1
MASGELACTYAALILSDDGIAITVRSSPSLSCSFNLKRFLSG